MVGQLQSCIQRVLAHNQSIGVCHHYAPKTDVRLLTFLDSLLAVSLGLIGERIAIIKQEIDFSDRLIDALVFDDIFEGPFTIGNKLGNDVFILLQASE